MCTYVRMYVCATGHYNLTEIGASTPHTYVFGHVWCLPCMECTGCTLSSTVAFVFTS